MIITIRDITLFMHMIFGMMWFGGIAFVGWGIYPILHHFKYLTRQQILYRLLKHVHLLLTLLGILTIGTGLILGIYLGPVHSFEVLFTHRYGQLFFAAFTIALLSLLWGACVSFPFTMRILKNEQYFLAAENGLPKILKQKMQHITLISSVEVIGLACVIYIMVLI